MFRIPTCMIMSIGLYKLIEPIVVESAEFGEPEETFFLGGHFGSIGANFYRAAHHLFTLSFALKHGVVETRRTEYSPPSAVLPGLFSFEGGHGSAGASSFTSATAVILGNKRPNGVRESTVVCGPGKITATEKGTWKIIGGNLLPGQVVPRPGSIVPNEQRLFFNQGFPILTVEDADEAALAWEEKCGFSKEFSLRLAKTLRWDVPEDGHGLSIPIYKKGEGFRLVFPDPEACVRENLETFGENDADIVYSGVRFCINRSVCGIAASEPIECACYRGQDSVKKLPGLIPYKKTGF